MSATPNDRETPENRETRRELQEDAGRVSGGPREAAGGTQAEPRESPVEPTARGIGRDESAWGSEAAGGSVIDKRPPESRGDGGRASPERLGERLREASEE